MSSHFLDLCPCPGSTPDDLDPALVEAYRQELNRRKPGSPALRQPAEELLLQVGALVRPRRHLQPTLTGMLFFGKNPQQFYPSLTIAFLQFAGISTTEGDPDAPLYLDNREFRGTLPAMIDAARATLFEKLGKRGLLSGFVRRDATEYPEFAYREAIVNAVGHRDYGLEGSHIQVRLFADRLEVQSPGGLGGHLTVDNMVYEQYTRNPHIMALLQDIGYVEQRGLGVDRMIRAMLAANLEAPTFEDRASSFWVILRGGPAAPLLSKLSRLGLNERQARAIAYLGIHGRITNREYQQEFGVSERTALYDLQGLVETGLVLPVSSGRGRHYILRD